MKAKPKTIIGWREWCSIESLGIPAIAAKIDTGAASSSLHAFNVKTFEDNDEQFVEFFVHPLRRKRHPEIKCKARVIETRTVISSNGQGEERPVISVPVKLGPFSFETDITLTNRDEMGFRMLVGRKFLAHRFIVDSSIAWTFGDIDEMKIYSTSSQHKQKQ